MHLLFAAILAVTQQWLLVSDLHVNPYDTATRPPPYGQDTNWALFDSALAQMRAAVPQARVVMIDGDSLAHRYATLVAQNAPGTGVSRSALQTMRRIEQSFARTFPRAQFLLALGNNDEPCGDYSTASHSAYRTVLARMWAPLVNRTGAAPAFVHDFSLLGSYTARLPSNGLRAIVVDDIPWSIFFRPCDHGSAGLPVREMTWLTQQLHGLPAGQRAVVMLHIPPGVDASSTLMAHRFLVVPFMRPDMVARFAQVLRANAQHVALVIAGHTHRSDFRLFGKAPMLVAPSISPIYANNPAFLRLEIDAAAPLQDYRMYAYDPYDDAWSPFFDFDAAYGRRMFTAETLAAAHDLIARDDGVRSQWEQSVLARRDASDVRRQWKTFWCAQTEFGPGYAGCAGDRRRVALLPIALVLALTAIAAVVVAVVVRLTRRRRAS